MKGRQLGLPFYLTWQYLRRGRKWTLLLTLFLMTVAFINLIFIPSLFNGIIDGANKQIINTLTGNVYITPSEGKSYIENKSGLIVQIKDVEGVQAASAKTLVPARLRFNNINGSWQTYAINPTNEKEVSNISQKIISGSYLESGDKDKIIIGKQVAGGKDVEENAFSFKDAKVGDKVLMILDSKTKIFTIKGIFDTNFVESDKRAFITDLALSELMSSSINKATSITIKTKESANEQEVIRAINQLNLDGQIYSWQESTGLMKSVSKSFLSINVIMSFVGVLIAAVTIIIIIYVTSINKRKEIGILRAIGIKPYIIISSYVILSAVYAMAGVILGTIIFFAVLTPYFQAHPFVLPICDAVLVLNWSDYVARAETIIWVSVIAGLIPALVVTRAKMLDAILGR
ncbi:MAG: ABC transporter permease [Candidatus Saccharibacteria bacterium]